MNRESVKRSVVQRAADDYTGLWEVIRTVERLSPGEDEGSLETDVISLITELYEEGKITLGFPQEGGEFDPWEISAADARERISREWGELGRRPNIGEIVWLSATDRGEATIE